MEHKTLDDKIAHERFCNPEATFSVTPKGVIVISLMDELNLSVEEANKISELIINKLDAIAKDRFKDSPFRGILLDDNGCEFIEIELSELDDDVEDVDLPPNNE
jgi:hypothetical protein